MDKRVVASLALSSGVVISHSGKARSPRDTSKRPSRWQERKASSSLI